ncbi:MAG: EamA family transporter [Rhodospirillaceae bacterium]|nr:EamA family transporter [Rhodospirillaceae bacterium]
MQHKPTLLDYGLLFLLAFVFGSTYLFVALGLETLPPLTLAAMRAGLGFAVLAGLAVALGHAIPRDRRSWRAFIFLGFFGGALPFTLMSLGQQRIDSSLAAILITTMPLFTLALAHVFTDDRANPRKVVGMVLGFVGILLLLGPAALRGHGGSLEGQLLYIGVALSYAVMGVIIRRLGAGSGTALSRTACSNFVATVMLVPIAFLFEAPLAIQPNTHSLIGLLGLGIISSTIGQFLVFRLNAAVGPNFTAVNNLLGPPVGIMWGVLLLGEEITWLRIAAMAVIFLGVAFATTGGGVARLAAPGRA